MGVRPFVNIRSPYPGLRPFNREEAPIFFGREEHVDALLERLQEKRLLAVLGQSGSGKSSLVKAGLIPALEEGLLPEAGGDLAYCGDAARRPASRPPDRGAGHRLGPEGLGHARSRFRRILEE